MKRCLTAAIALSTCSLHAYADYTPIQQIAISMEVLRLRADFCRAKWNAFSAPEVEAITESSVAVTQIAKFDLDGLTDLAKGIEGSIQLNHTKSECDAIHRFIFGVP